jgi:hypothetical protein
MYLGGTAFFGFVQYLVSGFDLLLDHGATWIEFEVGETFRLSSDARIPARIDEQGRLEPFEAPGPLKPRQLADGVILTALSEEIRVTLRDDANETVLTARGGKRESLAVVATNAHAPGTWLEFLPDDRIFPVTAASPRGGA